MGADLFIYGVRVYGDKQKEINAFPCFICKKFIINSGIKRVVCSTESGKLKTFIVDDWATEWKEKDLMDDAHKYDSKY
jgi:dCMP deaminase